LDLKELQDTEDTYLTLVNSKLNQLPVSGDWRWPDYGVTNVSAVVLGHRHPRPGDENWVEVVYALTFTSDHAIPHAGDGKYEDGSDGSHFTFTQLGNSVFANRGYVTQGLSTYVGTKPQMADPTKHSFRAGTPKALDMAGSPTKPHPPP